MSDLNSLFAQFTKTPLTAKVPVAFRGRKLKGQNELPLVTQAAANVIAGVVWSLSSPRGQANIQKSIEISVRRKFYPYLNSMARANRQSLHHVYEWNKVGQTSARLVDLVVPQTSRGKTNFTMKVEFRPSKTLVPLTEAQRTPNKATGAVVKQKHIFYNKAMVMEYGLTVHIAPLGRSKMAFDNPSALNSLSGVSGVEWSKETKSGLTFTSRPITINYSKRPTYHGLQGTLSVFFRSVGADASKDAVQQYSRRAMRRSAKTSHMIKVAVPSDGYAHSIGKKVADSLVVQYV